jgi:hypothetical protein
MWFTGIVSKKCLLVHCIREILCVFINTLRLDDPCVLFHRAASKLNHFQEKIPVLFETFLYMEYLDQ